MWIRDWKIAFLRVSREPRRHNESYRLFCDVLCLLEVPIYLGARVLLYKADMGPFPEISLTRTSPPRVFLPVDLKAPEWNRSMIIIRVLLLCSSDTVNQDPNFFFVVDTWACRTGNCYQASLGITYVAKPISKPSHSSLHSH